MEKKPIYEKLLAAQKKIGAIAKDSTNPFFHSKYFDINALLDAVKPVLNDNGLILLQPLEADKLKTIIIDAESGEQLESVVNLPVNPDPQKMGSIITYFRRYSLQSFLGLQAEDDDAELAANREPRMTPKPPNTGKTIADGLNNVTRKITETEATAIRTALEDIDSPPDFPAFCKRLGIARVEDLSASLLPQARKVVVVLRKESKEDK